MISRLIKVKGIVQGVGFRPFVHRLAVEHGISGTVRNTSGSVVIEASAKAVCLRGFIRAIRMEKPSSARINSITIENLGKTLKPGIFKILKSSGSAEIKLVPPDIKTCAKCADEFNDKTNRRFHYPFINCTECGPRFTIIRDTPYDRKNTTMAEFRMCSACGKEYGDINDRRYHAEPNACPACGPRAWLADPDGRAIERDNEKVFITARSLLKKGKIIAVKGLGGFHIAADASNEKAVQLLKKRKHRSNKPFAVMAASFEVIKKHAFAGPFEEGLFNSPEAPIVLLRSRKNSPVARLSAAGLKHIGFFLPYTPLHFLLFEKGLETLVMTSANISEEPIQHDNKQAVEALKGIADYYILHDRPINIPADDSVIKPYGKDKNVIIRRSRGFVPVPVEVKSGLPDAIGTGALLKNTLCFIRDGRAFMSQHIGDLENRRAFDYFRTTVDNFVKFYGLKPSVIACDMHPNYMSTRFAGEYAEKEKIPLISVQHHYSHMLSVMAEHGHYKKSMGIIMDGTGYGDDGNTWGGEFLVGDFRGYKRAGHLKYLKLPGGDLASKQVFRTAISILSGFLSESEIKTFYRGHDAAGILQSLSRRINTPLSSGAGRLFDAAASILGICHVSTYDAEAPMKLEAAATGIAASGSYGYKITTICDQREQSEINDSPAYRRRDTASRISTTTGSKYIVDFEPAFKQMWKLKKDKKAPANFHLTFASALAKTAELISKDTGIRDIVLSGGVFQNTVLLQMLLKKLQIRGFNVLIHEKLSPNDSSIALGQAVYAARRQNAGMRQNITRRR